MRSFKLSGEECGQLKPHISKHQDRKNLYDDSALNVENKKIK